MTNFIPTQIDRFEQDGYLLLRAAGEISDLHSRDPFERRWYRVWRQHGGEQDVIVGWSACRFSKPWFELWVNSAILGSLVDLLGPEIQFNGDYWIRPKLDFVQLWTEFP